MEVFLRPMINSAMTQILSRDSYAMDKRANWVISERTLTEHSSVHDIGIAEADLDGMHRVHDFLDQERYH